MAVSAHHLLFATLLSLSSLFFFATHYLLPAAHVSLSQHNLHYCPRDTLKLGVCADLLGGVVNVVLGTPASSKCCSLLEGLADLEVAACLCTAIKANVLGINLNVPVALSLLVSACGKSIPDGFKCG